MGKKKKGFDWMNVRKAYAYFRRLWPFLKPSWFPLVLVVVGMALYAGGYAIRLVVIKPFIEFAEHSDEMTEMRAMEIIEYVAPLSLVLLVGAVAMAVGTFLRQYFLGYAQAYTVVNLQRAIVARILTQPLRFFNNERKGALMSRMTANTRAAGKLVQIVLEAAVSHPLKIIAVMAVLIYTSPLLALGALLIVPVALGPVVLFAGRIRKATHKKYQKLEASSNFFHQMLDGIRVVKSYRLEEAQREEFQRVSEDVFRRDRKVARYKGTSRFGVELTYNAVMAGALFGVGFIFTAPWFVAQGGVGMFVQFFAGLIFLYDPARRLSHSLNEVQESTAALDRAFELLDREPELRDRPGAVEAPEEFQTVRFEGVHFEYEPGQPVLRDINFEARRGQMVAFVGQSGMGKSTLMDLIPRFYDPTQGAVHVDGTDLRDIRNESWLTNIAIVSQDTFLFNTTIAHNLRAGRPDATDAELQEAARAANIWDEIQAMPEGMATRLGDRGVTLSGGQRQRVAIARAFLRKAPILLLDEATSALDTRSEREVQKALDSLIKGCTVFAVAHRLSTIRNADCILVLHDGRVIEQGTHDELIGRNGTYANAWRLQQGEAAETEAAR
jgi:ATP-binding cassette, subfamily B, bacterial MsbA